MKSILAFTVLLLGAVLYHQAQAAPKQPLKLTKVFNYQDSMPIKDDRTGEVIKNESNETATGMTEQEQAEAEAACWKLINEKSVVTFALQKRVLDDLAVDMKNVTMGEDLRAAVEKLSKSLRENLDDALESLKRDAVDDYFDSLFEASEEIIHLSALLRDPNLDDRVFLVLAKAVSRLGRNNSMLIQEFSEMCSFIQHSPRPKASNST